MKRSAPTAQRRPQRGVWVAVALTMGVALIGLTANCQQPSRGGSLSLRTLEVGLEYGAPSVRQAGSDTSTTLHVLRFDPLRFTMAAVPASETGAALADAHAFRVARQGVAAINGGYFDPQYRPLGLLVSGGRRRRRLRRVDHGIFQIANRKPGLQHAQRYHKPIDLEFAVECGPRLVVDGKPLKFKPGVNRRTVIAHDRQGRVIVLASAGVISLADLAAWLVLPQARGGLGVVGALNLDGGSSTMFELAHGQVQVAVHSPIRVPVGLALVRRPTATAAAVPPVPTAPPGKARNE